MYLDSAYIAKFYLTEPDSADVRAAIAGTETRISSMGALGEVVCAFHRHLREGRLTGPQWRRLIGAFLGHVDADIWRLLPVTDRILREMTRWIAGLPREIYVRTGDALHLTTALDQGEREIWTSDRHLLAAAPHFGLSGRTV